MAGVSLEITLDEIPDLAAAVARAHDLATPFDSAGARLVTSTKRRFETGTGPDGRRWKPSQRALRTGGQTLVDKAHLFNSIVHQVTADTITVGSNLVYARPNQMGGKVGRNHAVNLPAREYLGLDDGDKAMLVEEVEDWLAGAWS